MQGDLYEVEILSSNFFLKTVMMELLEEKLYIPVWVYMLILQNLHKIGEVKITH